MEIVLRKEDIEKLIKIHYKEATSIKFSGKNPKITIEMDSFKIETPQNVEPKTVTKHDINAVSVPSAHRQTKPSNVMTTERKIINL